MGNVKRNVPGDAGMSHDNEVDTHSLAIVVDTPMPGSALQIVTHQDDGHSVVIRPVKSSAAVSAKIIQQWYCVNEPPK